MLSTILEVVGNLLVAASEK